MAKAVVEEPDSVQGKCRDLAAKYGIDPSQKRPVGDLPLPDAFRRCTKLEGQCKARAHR